MKINILILVISFLSIEIITYNPDYKGNDAEGSFESFFIKNRLIKEDYIKYFPYYKKWIEDFSNVDTSKINLDRVPSPYNQLKFVLPFNPKGWYFNGEYVSKLFQFNNITTAIEIGSYLGVSTRHIASLLTEGGKLYAIDTWNVFEKHYEQFLSNIVISGLADKVIPIKNDSRKAVEFIQLQNKKFDFIYVDAGHEMLDVLLDLENYFQFLNTTGIICGDDWLWVTVRYAVEFFAKKYDLTIYADCSFWFLKKEDCGYCYKSFLTADDSAWKFDNKINTL